MTGDHSKCSCSDSVHEITVSVRVQTVTGDHSKCACSDSDRDHSKCSCSDSDSGSQ